MVVAVESRDHRTVVSLVDSEGPSLRQRFDRRMFRDLMLTQLTFERDRSPRQTQDSQSYDRAGNSRETCQFYHLFDIKHVHLFVLYIHLLYMYRYNYINTLIFPTLNSSSLSNEVIISEVHIR